MFKRYRYALWFFISLATFICIFYKTAYPVEQVKNGVSCFFSGCITFCIFDKIKDRNFKGINPSLIEMLLFVSTIYIIASEIDYKYLIANILFCSTILVFSFEKGLISSLLKRKIFLILGKLSYSIYMIHAAVLFCLISLMMIAERIIGFSLAPMVEGRRALTLGNDIVNNLLVFCILILIIYISLISNKYIETPFQKLGRKLISTSKSKIQ